MKSTTKTIEKILGFSAGYAAERLDELTARESGGGRQAYGWP